MNALTPFDALTVFALIIVLMLFYGGSGRLR